MHIATKILKAILLAAGKKDIRKYLCCVHINERHIVATDGHRLHAYSHGQEWAHGQVTIPRGAVEMALKAKTVDIEITDVSVGAVSYKPVDAKYPDYMRVIPAVNVPAGIGVRVIDCQPDYIKDANAMIAAVRQKDDRAGADLYFVGDCYTWQKPNAAVVVMPYRSTPCLEQFK